MRKRHGQGHGICIRPADECPKLCSFIDGRFVSFGVSLAAEGNQLVVGSPRKSMAHRQAGAVYLYDAASQNLLRTLTSPNVNDCEFRLVVAESTDAFWWAHRMPSRAEPPTCSTRAVAHCCRLSTIHACAAKSICWSVAFSGDNVVVGAPGDGSAAYNGSAYAFQIESGSLLATLSDPAPKPGGQFGWAVAGLDAWPSSAPLQWRWFFG